MADIQRTFPTKEFGEAKIDKTNYINGGLAIQLYCTNENGLTEPLARLSMWLHESPKLPGNCFFVKMYSENGLIIEDCAKSGWFKPRKDLSVLYKEPVWELLDNRDEHMIA